MRISVTVCGQSNALGQWRNQSDTAPFPPAGLQWPDSNLTTLPGGPNANDPDNQGNAIWPYVAQLLYRRHGVKTKFWNAAVGGTSLARDWNGTNIVTAADSGTGALTTSGTTLTSATGGLDALSDGDIIRPRNMGANEGAWTITGTPSATSATVTSAFTESGTYSAGAIREGNPPVAGGAGFDPNSYYATARTAFERGTYDHKLVLCQWGNNDYLLRQSQNDLETQLGRFVDYWQARSADAILLGGTLLSNGVGGTTVYDDRQIFMQDAWATACAATVNGADVLAGPQLGELVSYNVPTDSWLKSDNAHFNFTFNFLAAEAWYSAIATALGFTPTTAGAVDTDFPQGRIA